MHFPTAVALAATLLVSVPPCMAQSTAIAAREAAPQAMLPPGPTTTWLAPGTVDLSPEAAKAANPFKALGGDFRHFFSGDNARFLGLASVLAVAAAPWDRETAKETQEHWGTSAAGTFKSGNVGGGFFAQMGAGLVIYGVGKAVHSNEFAALGGDLFRAQMVSQLVVQGVKFATRRPRPDGSDSLSFPSGHTASAFATATILERRYGWKAGAPAFAFASYVGASRMSANKHHLSDVLMGAAIGMAAGRTVSVGMGGAKFGLGAMATKGGAAVTFTKQ